MTPSELIKAVEELDTDLHYRQRVDLHGGAAATFKPPSGKARNDTARSRSTQPRHLAVPQRFHTRV